MSKLKLVSINDDGVKIKSTHGYHGDFTSDDFIIQIMEMYSKLGFTDDVEVSLSRIEGVTDTFNLTMDVYDDRVEGTLTHSYTEEPEPVFETVLNTERNEDAPVDEDHLDNCDSKEDEPVFGLDIEVITNALEGMNNKISIAVGEDEALEPRFDIQSIMAGVSTIVEGSSAYDNENLTMEDNPYMNGSIESAHWEYGYSIAGMFAPDNG